MPLDLADVLAAAEAAERGRPVAIMGPDGESLGASVVIRGVNSATYRREQSRLMLRQFRKPLSEDAAAAQVEENRLQLVTACVVSWEGVVSGGEPIECSPQNITRVLAAAPWLLFQLEAAQNTPRSLTPAKEE